MPWKRGIAAMACVVAMILVVATTTPLYVNVVQKEQHAQQVQAYRAAKMAQYEQENAHYADYEVEVAFLGDSLTDLCDLERYYPQYVTVNRGIGGDTTYDLQGRLQVSVYDLKPQVAVMLIGANNADTMLDNYEDILIGLRDNLPDTKVVLVSMTAMGGDVWGKWNDRARANNVEIERLAGKYGFTYVDLFTPMFDSAIGEVGAAYTVDGGHFSHEGYLLAAEIITPVLDDLLGK